jgi:hypothetical protein
VVSWGVGDIKNELGVMPVQLLVFVLSGACFSFSRTEACMDMFVQPQKKNVTFKNTTKKRNKIYAHFIHHNSHLFTQKRTNYL